MTSKRDRGGGSFREIRERHLMIFERDGWRGSSRDVETKESSPKRRWKRDGIIHYAVEDSD